MGAAHRFVNWAGNQQSEVKQVHEPETAEALCRILAESSSVRVTGTAHSWSPLCITTETLIRTHRMNRPLGIADDRKSVWVEGGMKLWEISAWLDAQGLALPNLGSIDQQSIAGAVASGTHGTGIQFSILASMVLEFNLVLADGSIQNFSKEHGPDGFALAVVHLGALGVVSSMRIAVVPAYRLHEISFTLPLQEAIERLPEFLAETDHLKYWWFPHTSRMMVYRYQRTSEPRNDSKLRQWVVDEVFSVGVYRSLAMLGNFRTGLRKPINRLLVNLVRPLNRKEVSYRVFRVPEPPVHRETEWAFPLEQARALMKDYLQWIERSGTHFNFIQEFRFTQADRFGLSPSYRRDSLWIGMYQMDNRGWNDLLSGFEKWAKARGGRPHWGKEFTPDPQYLKAQYPEWDAFVQLRNQLDPQRKFSAPFMREIFGS